MTRGQILPVAIMLLSFGSSVLYLLDGDWRRGLYWLAAGLITVSMPIGLTPTHTRDSKNGSR